jgi:hypothetical protein
LTVEKEKLTNNHKQQKMKLVKTLRTLGTHARYEAHCAAQMNPGCYLCKAVPIREYKHWNIIQNEFPYDEVATESHILVPKRHSKEEGLTVEEIQELADIKPDTHETYDLIMENTHKQKSIPGHFHTHLLKIRERVMTEYERPQAVFLTPQTAKLTIGRG